MIGPVGRIAVYLEVGAKRTFANAVDWPGWSRHARAEADALEAVFDYAPRYARAVGAAAAFEPPSTLADLDVVERLEGDATTDFGAPSAWSTADLEPMDERAVARHGSLLSAAWSALNAAARAAEGKELATGPRGGGRSLAKIVDHVADAEIAYLSKLGSRRPPAGVDSREFVLEVLAARARDEEPSNPSRVAKRWPPRFFVRRAAWHALDHAWEIEDRVAEG